MGYGLLVGIVEDSVAAGLRVSNGSFGWDGAYGTQTWIDPKEKMVTIVMIQTQVTSGAEGLRERRDAGDRGVAGRAKWGRLAACGGLAGRLPWSLAHPRRWFLVPGSFRPGPPPALAGTGERSSPGAGL
jgi:hypothetical protein